jgi:DNA-damage-inducible protein D
VAARAGAVKGLFMTSLALKFDDAEHDFEAYGHENGSRFWYARDLMRALGYENFDTFEKGCVNKAIGVCTTLKIPVLENIQQEKREIDGKPCWDYRLSRFGCYLVAMNGDSKKPQVAAAQAFFASMAEAMRKYIENSENVERVLIRDDVSERERSLSGVAHAAGVVQYGFFQNAGYRGMYNMDLGRLRQWKGIESDRSLLDFMGKQELAANLFRITQTEARIRNENIRGQRGLENAAHAVGKSVRETMIKTSGSRPEQLPIAEDIKVVRKSLKSAEKQFAKLDKP